MVIIGFYWFRRSQGFLKVYTYRHYFGTVDHFLYLFPPCLRLRSCDKWRSFARQVCKLILKKLI